MSKDTEHIHSTELARLVAAEAGIPIKHAERLLRATRETIARLAEQGHAVVWTGLGTFAPRQRRSRAGINPRTKEAITIPGSATVGFSPSTALRDRVRKARQGRSF